MFLSAGLHAQELLLDEFPALRDKAVVLQMTTRIQEKNKEVWNANNSRVTIPGRPVSIKLVGENLIIEILFTVEMATGGKYKLAARSQVWINVPEKGMSYKTTNHSAPIGFGEQILYLPLGSDSSSDNPRIEMRLTMYRYGEAPAMEEMETP
jgi:hypothetical protein